MSCSQHPLISLCMIVKNEEKHIVRCLSSVKDYVDEILVLDTGSTDWTPLLAKELGATVHFAPWELDFAKARNKSKQKARGEWVLYLDADEEISLETGYALRQLAQQPVDGYTFNVINFTNLDEHSQKQIGINLRMFRNKPEYVFEGAIHEQIKSSMLCNNPNTVIKHSGFNILHYGYCLNNSNRKQKNLRNIEILQKIIQDKPDDHFNHYNLALSYYVNGQLENSKRHYQLAKKYVSDSANYLPALYRNYAICLNQLGEYGKAINLLEEGMCYFPDYLDLYYLQGQIYLYFKLFAKAEKSFKECLNFVKSNPNYTTTKGAESFLTYEYLADINSLLEKWDKALDNQLLAIETGAKSYHSALRLAQIAKRNFADEQLLFSFLRKKLPHINLPKLLNIAFDAGLYRLVIREGRPVSSIYPKILMLTAKAYMHLNEWQNAKKIILKIPDTSTEYFHAQAMGFICCCFEKVNADFFLASLKKINQGYAEDCRYVNELFLGNKKVYANRQFSNSFIDIVYQLMILDLNTTLNAFRKCYQHNCFARLCYAVGKLALNLQNDSLAEDLLWNSLAFGYQTSDIYRLLGKLKIRKREELEAIYLVKQSVLRQPSESINYHHLLDYTAQIIAKELRNIIDMNPDFALVKHHLYALGTFRTRLEGKEEWI